MKKILAIVAIGLLSLWLSFAVEGDLRDWMDTLHDEIPFGYTISQKVSVDQIAVDRITIKSPVIQDELGHPIKKYTVMFSQYPLSQILDNIALIDQAKEKTFEFTTVGTSVNLELISSVDGISPSAVYYLSVIPKDANGILWEISNELRFKLATQTHGEGAYSEQTGHTAAWANMTLANVTHTITNNNATLRWTAVAGSTRIDIFSFNPTSALFERLSTVNMSDESYTFALTRNGEYIINFVPNNGGTEYRYTFIVSGITATTTTPWTTTPTIWAIPATGPKENILIALAIAVVLYIVYRRVRAKH